LNSTRPTIRSEYNKSEKPKMVEPSRVHSTRKKMVIKALQQEVKVKEAKML